MAHTVWKGSLSFGLVNVPVGLYPATEDRTVHFHQFQEGTADRIRLRKVNERTGDEVPTSTDREGLRPRQRRVGDHRAGGTRGHRPLRGPATSRSPTSSTWPRSTPSTSGRPTTWRRPTRALAGLPAAGAGHGEVRQGGYRPAGDAWQGVPLCRPGPRRRPGPRDALLRRRDPPARRDAQRGQGCRRPEITPWPASAGPGAGHGRAAGRVP